MNSKRHIQIDMTQSIQPQTQNLQYQTSNNNMNPQLQVYAEQNKVRNSLIKKPHGNKATFTLRQYLRLNQMFTKTKGSKMQISDRFNKPSRKAAILMMKRQNQKQFQVAINKLKKCHQQINKRLQLNQSDADLHFLCNIQKIIHENILKNVDQIQQKLSQKMNIDFSYRQNQGLKNVQSSIQFNLKSMDIEK